MHLVKDSDFSTKVFNKYESLINEASKSNSPEHFLIYKIASLTVMIEEQVKIVSELTETLNKIVDNA